MAIFKGAQVKNMTRDNTGQASSAGKRFTVTELTVRIDSRKPKSR